MKKIRWVIIILIAIIIVAFCIPGIRNFLVDQFTMSPTVKTTTNENEVPEDNYNVELKGINVPNAKLSDFKGQLLFLNFWGTWCPPCRQEWPTIQKLYDQKQDKVKFVLIAMQDKEEDIKKFLNENHYNVPVYIASSPLPDQFLVSIFPTTFIIDKNYKIIKKSEGIEDWNDKEIHQLIDMAQ